MKPLFQPIGQVTIRMPGISEKTQYMHVAQHDDV